MKRTIFLLMTICLLFVLAACGQSSNAPAPSTSVSVPASSEPTQSSALGNDYEDYYVTWSFASSFPAGSPFNEMNEKVMNERLMEMTGGHISIEFYPSGTLGTWGSALQNCLDGGVDMAYDIPMLYPGVFPYLEASSFAGYTAIGSVAQTYLYNDYYDKFAPDELDAFYLVSLYGVGNTGMVSNIPITKLSDMAGGTWAMQEDVYTGLGINAAISSETVNEVYEAMKFGAINGSLVGYYACMDFNFYEVGTSFTAFDFHCGNSVIVLNKDKYNDLPDGLKAIVDEWSEWVTYEVLGPFGDDLSVKTKEVIGAANPDFRVYWLSEEEVQEVVDRSYPLTKSRFESLGIDTDAWDWLVENAPLYSERYQYVDKNFDYVNK